MENLPEKKISAIIPNEQRLEFIISKLLEKEVGRHNISVQASANELIQKYGESFPTPEVIQDSRHAPKKESFLKDDFGWVLGLSFSIPLFICLVLGIFVIGDVRSFSDNLLYGTGGIIAGSLIGLGLATVIKNRYRRNIKKQEKEGGFVLWVSVMSKEQSEAVIAILKQYKAESIQEKNTHSF